MPVSYSFDDPIVAIHMKGEYSVLDLENAVLAALADPARPARPVLMYDLRESRALRERPTEDVRGMARFLARNRHAFNSRLVMVAPSDELFEKTVSNLEEARARGGKIISIGTGDNVRLKSISDRYLSMPKSHWSTNPLLAVVPLQLLAFHLAQNMGYDVDQPRNLAKSVTVE